MQPAEHIELSEQITNNRDSILIVSLTVDPKIPDDSLNATRAKLVLSSFITILPNQNLRSFSSCKIVFLKKEGSLVSKSRAIEYICPMTADLVNRVDNFKDSTRAAIGYIDPNWTYNNQDLNLSLPLKAGWYYASDEHDSLVYYAIGSDISQLPQYRTDTDRKVTFLTLQSLDPGSAYPVLQLSKSKELLTGSQNGKFAYKGQVISIGLTLNLFDSEDEYLKKLVELYFSKKLPDNEIHSYRFGNASFRGHQFAHQIKNGKMVYNLTAIKRFPKVSLMLNLMYLNDKELEEIKNELSGLKIN
ncbi:MAG TPA: hypothetical protein VK588_10065 [Chitinophagaceae bacterium]|nr:hypothetical protein [Chitinophagaceae bacterium]